MVRGRGSAVENIHSGRDYYRHCNVCFVARIKRSQKVCMTAASIHSEDRLITCFRAPGTARISVDFESRFNTGARSFGLHLYISLIMENVQQ